MMRVILSRSVLPWAALSSVAIATSAGYFNQTALCVDAPGMEKCYDKAEKGFANCITSNCSGGNKTCYDDCNGDAMCMTRECPDLGVECINACGCVKATDHIDCTASSCWNLVYSCDYQKTALDVLNLCLGFDMNQIPFWPAPSDAPGGCSCNIGQVARKETLISAHLAECKQNSTNLNRLSSTKDTANYTQACICCAQSAVVSALWNTCPDTKPSEIGADYWYDAFLKPHHWEECGPYIDAYDCGNDLGYSAEDAGGTQDFCKPKSLPENGTQTLFYTGSTVTTPVSGATFTWTDGSLMHAITAASIKDNVLATGTGTMEYAATSTAAGAAATKTGGAACYRSPAWADVGIAGVLAVVLA